MTVGERIRVVRKDQGLTQKAFGERISMIGSSISLIESGAVKATGRTIQAICNTFNVSRDWLVNGEGTMYEQRTESKELLLLDFAEVIEKYPAVYEMAKLAAQHLTENDWKRINELFETIGG